MKKLQWTRRALFDLENTLQYIAENNPDSAKKISKKIYDSVIKLSEFPYLGKPCDIANYREIIIPYFPYSVIYRIYDENIEILRVLHDAQENVFK